MFDWGSMNCSNAGWNAPAPGGRTEPDEDAPGPYGTAWRTCRYCGSIHPDDLLALLRAGAAPHEADWKYGYPHKLYIENVPNPLAGEWVCDGGMYEGGKKTPHYGLGPATAFVKFYTRHLAHAADFDALTAALSAALPNLAWMREEDGIKWRGFRGAGVR